MIDLLQSSRPIFEANPLKIMVNNQISGTLSVKNLNYVNKIYELMKNAVFYDNSENFNGINLTSTNINVNSSNINHNHLNTNNNAPENVNNIFTTSKPAKKVFISIKGEKIFNIIKENNLKNKRSVKIIYSNEEENSEDSDKKNSLMKNKKSENIEFNNIRNNENELIEKNYYSEEHDEEEKYFENINCLNNQNEQEICEEHFEEENRNEGQEDYLYPSYQSWKSIFK